MSDWTHHATHVRPSRECHLCSGTPRRMAIAEAETALGRDIGLGTTPKTYLEMAQRRIAYRFETFAKRIHESEREAFFHPCNADAWVREFARWLDEEQTESADIRASND